MRKISKIGKKWRKKFKKTWETEKNIGDRQRRSNILTEVPEEENKSKGTEY